MTPLHSNYSEKTLEITEQLKEMSFHLKNAKDLDPLMERIGNARYVLLGEASHGTHEYYTWRSRISKRLIKEKGFSFIAVEGDWPDCYRLNRYIKGYPQSGNNALSVLQNFERWPTWMWANWEIAALAEWLREHNLQSVSKNKTGFYGLDVYSLWESIESIINYLKKTDPEAQKVAEKAFRCFEPYAEEGTDYARATQMVPISCEKEVVKMLLEIRSKVAQYNTDREMVFSTEQNAIVAVNAERYYRAMIKGGAESWNVRDRHMVETLNRLMNFHGPDAKAIIWEHNTHIGDARATDMRYEGMINVGELVRKERGAKDVVLVGFGSYRGTVIAGRKWGDEMRKIDVPNAMKGSWEYLLHKAEASDKLLIMDRLKKEKILADPIGHRAIGVVYNPEYEQYGNYVPSILPERYDAFLFLNDTKALHPLHIQPDGHQIPETYPWGV